MDNQIIMAWSGGKDSALALHELSLDKTIRIVALLTTVTEGFDRISMHGVRRDLLARQAASLGFPLEEVSIPQACSNEIYEERMGRALGKHRKAGVTEAAFGDLFLESVRTYREERLGRIGMRGIFPLWGRNTTETARRFIQLGYHATIVCVDTTVLSPAFAGREYDDGFLRDLPAGMDACGENGEFHTFVTDGPMFKKPIPVQRGEMVTRDGRFRYCDLISAP